MKATYYAQALADTLTGDQKKDMKTVLVRLQEVLKRRGHQKLLPAIVRALSLQLAKRERASTVTIRTVSGEARKELLEQYAQVLPKEKEYAVRIVADPTLASGFVLETATRRVDGSGKRALMELHRNIMSEV